MSPPFSFHVVPRLPNPAKEEDLPAHEVTFPPRPYWECTPILTDVNPESGSMTGGMIVWLQGFDFSPDFPVFAMFGDVAVPTVRVLLSMSPVLSKFLRHSLVPVFLPVVRLQQPQ